MGDRTRKRFQTCMCVHTHTDPHLSFFQVQLSSSLWSTMMWVSLACRSPARENNFFFAERDIIYKGNYVSSSLLALLLLLLLLLRFHDCNAIDDIPLNPDETGAAWPALTHDDEYVDRGSVETVGGDLPVYRVGTGNHR